MIRLKIEGMSCGHCRKAVEEALSAVPGVTAVPEVNVERGEAVVEGNPDPKALLAAVEEAGYQAGIA
ncbi:MAG TPA: heavy-metal-associated domain-containing protein [Gammaproteobacteria bacterium]|nr:heavy-metal-associated domain-containing protein [Gammaproteobacteria bacterium]